MDQFLTGYDLSRTAQECSEHLKRLFLKADTQSLFSEFRPVEIDFENAEPHCSSRYPGHLFTEFTITGRV